MWELPEPRDTPGCYFTVHFVSTTKNKDLLKTEFIWVWTQRSPYHYKLCTWTVTTTTQSSECFLDKICNVKMNEWMRHTLNAHRSSDGQIYEAQRKTKELSSTLAWTRELTPHAVVLDVFIKRGNFASNCSFSWPTWQLIGSLSSWRWRATWTEEVQVNKSQRVFMESEAAGLSSQQITHFLLFLWSHTARYDQLMGGEHVPDPSTVI